MIVYRWDFLHLHINPKTKTMKFKLIVVALAVLFMTSCKTKKATIDKEVPVTEKSADIITVAEAKPFAVLSPVEENPETIKLASTFDGGNLYTNNCAKCHKLYKTEDFSKEDWVPIMKRMQKKARITDAETLAIYNYLTAQNN